MEFSAHKVKFLGTYLTVYRELMRTHLVKFNNHHSKRTAFLASNIIKLYSSYTGHHLVAVLLGRQSGCSAVPVMRSELSWGQSTSNR